MFWKKIGVMFENKNVVNRVLVFRKIVRLRYQDGSSMAEHLNAFQGLINQTTSLEVPMADEVFALLLLASLSESWGMLVMTLSNARPQGKKLSLEMVKLSLLNEEARWKEREAISDHKALVTKGDSYRGRDRQRGSKNRGRSRLRSKSKGKLTCFYYGKPGHFQKNNRHYRKYKGGANGVVPKKILDSKNTSAITTSEEELFISEKSEVNLVGEESTWVADSNASFQLTS